VCSSIQLIEQTAEKADGYGLDVTTYYRGSYNNDLFSLGKAPCITTYQALFNGNPSSFTKTVLRLFLMMLIQPTTFYAIIFLYVLIDHRFQLLMLKY